MSKRNKFTLLRGFVCSVVCSFVLTGGVAALAEPAPESVSENLLSITANRLPLLQSDRKGGFVKAELSGKEIQLNRVTASGQVVSSAFFRPWAALFVKRLYTNCRRRISAGGTSLKRFLRTAEDR